MKAFDSLPTSSKYIVVIIALALLITTVFGVDEKEHDAPNIVESQTDEGKPIKFTFDDDGKIVPLTELDEHGLKIQSEQGCVGCHDK